jgi:murein L,D-transpeptidase YafK
MKYILLFFLLIWASCNGETPKKNSNPEIIKENLLINYEIGLQKLVDSLKLDKNKLSVRVTKCKYILSICIDTLVIKSYPVVLGFNAIDDKLREGDGCTPEGTFKVRAKYPHRSWSKFIWFDYPNSQSRIKHNKAKREGKIPLNASIGGSVGIHGVPSGMDYLVDQGQNWTLGCVSLKNKDIDEIYDFITLQTIIEIRG